MSDPKRLLDEHRGGELSSLLSAGKSELPDDAQLGALAAKVGILGGLGGAGAAGAAGGGGGAGAGAKVAGAAATAKTGLALKIGGAVVVASAASASAIVATNVRSPSTATPVGIVATAAPSDTAAASSAPTSLHIAETSAPVPADESSSAPVRRPPPLSSRAPAGASAEGPEAEVRLLERAQDALRTRPAEALALADDHARRFPNGMLAQEREVIAVEALVKAGRVSDAKARAERFKQRFPGSSHARRIDTLVGE